MEHLNFERGKSLQQAESWIEAEKAYRLVIEENPKSFRALNNLGTVLEQQGKLPDAIESYKLAIHAKPTEAIPHYNLGNAYHRDGQLEAAEASYRRCLEQNPDHVDAAFNLGRALYDQTRLEEALTAYQRAVALDPEYVGGHSSVGGVLIELGRLDEAEPAIRRALELDPNSSEEHFNLGRVLEGQGKMDDASWAYRKALDVNPENTTTKESLGRMLHSAGRQDEAVEFLNEWIKREPDNAIPKHMLASITGENVESRASDDYVRDTFDRFADQFDETLKRLEYRAPSLVMAVLVDDYKVQRNAFGSVLDAGCGTGLAGTLLRPMTRRMEGVDLSSKMLAKAQALNVYDELFEAELTAFVSERHDLYDCVVAADTLCYFGDLEEVVNATFQSMKSGGAFVFTLERMNIEDDGRGYVLNPHGRYSHSEDYARRVLEGAGFKVRAITVPTLRREAGLPVLGLLLAADKP